MAVMYTSFQCSVSTAGPLIIVNDEPVLGSCGELRPSRLLARISSRNQRELLFIDDFGEGMRLLQ